MQLSFPRIYTAKPFDATPSGHCAALDGVRGLAILLVFFFDALALPEGGPFTQAFRKLVGVGWTGVDLFFVLSGFLITGILLDTKGNRGYFSSFFLRRAVRIFPLYYVALLFAFFLLPLLAWIAGASELLHGLASLRADQVWFWCYLQNCLFASRQAWPEHSYLNHFWSLAVEEQFYLLWPFAVWLLPRRKLVPVCLGLCLLATALRFALHAIGAGYVPGYTLMLTRLDSLCVGAALAAIVRERTTYVATTRLALGGFAGFGLALLIGDTSLHVLEFGTYAATTIGHLWFAIMWACLIAIAATTKENTVCYRLLTNRSLISLGKYSYALYVLHRPVHHLVTMCNWTWLPDSVAAWAIFAASLAFSLVLARISWLIIERPALRLKKHFPRPSQPHPA